MKSSMKLVQLFLALGAVAVLGACSAPSENPDATVDEEAAPEEVTPEATEAPEDASAEEATDAPEESMDEAEMTDEESVEGTESGE